VIHDHKKLLTSFIEVVTFLFAAFGGFLRAIAPPDEVNSSYPIGILSFFTLIILLTVSAVARQSSASSSFRGWLIVGLVAFALAMVAAFEYHEIYYKYTYVSSSGIRKVSADNKFLTPDASQFQKQNPTAAPADLAKNFADDDIWTRDGLNAAEQQLLFWYAFLVLTLATSIFCLLEANAIRS
jgi:hypothetical protein